MKKFFLAALVLFTLGGFFGLFPKTSAANTVKEIKAMDFDRCGKLQVDVSFDAALNCVMPLLERAAKTCKIDCKTPELWISRKNEPNFSPGEVAYQLGLWKEKELKNDSKAKKMTEGKEKTKKATKKTQKSKKVKKTKS